MKTFALFFGFFFGNNYVPEDGAAVYLRSETVVINDKVSERIISITEGKKPFTYSLLWVENDEIVLELNN